MAQTTINVSKNTAFLATGKGDAREGVTKNTAFLATGKTDAQAGAVKIVAYLVTLPTSGGAPISTQGQVF